MSYLINTYIIKQLQDSKYQGTYPPRKSLSPAKTLYYLVWLAQKLEGESKTKFLIEAIQTTWLDSYLQKLLYKVIYVLGFGLINGLVYGMSYIILISLTLTYEWLTGELSSTRVDLVTFLMVWIFAPLILTLVSGLIFALGFGIINGLINGFIKPITIGGKMMKAKTNSPFTCELF